MANHLSERPSTSNFTLEQLADRLDLHYTAIYHYFAGKHDLSLALIQGICERRIELLNHVRSLPGPAIGQMVEFISMDLRDPPTDVPQRTISVLKEPFRGRAQQAQARVTEAIVELLKRGLADGSMETTDPRVAAALIRRILNRYRNRGEKLLSSQTTDRIAEVVVALVCQGIAVDRDGWSSSISTRPRPFPRVSSPIEGADRVVRSLTEEFNRLGYEGTSVPRVARNIGVSKTSFYKYASSKEELLYLCARQTMDLIGQVRQIAKVVTDDPIQALLYNLYYARYLRTHAPGPTLDVGNFRSLESRHEVLLWEIFKRWRNDLLELINRGVDNGQIRTLEPQLMLPIMNLCSAEPIRAESVEEGFGDEVARFLYRGISAEGSY